MLESPLATEKVMFDGSIIEYSSYFFGYGLNLIAGFAFGSFGFGGTLPEAKSFKSGILIAILFSLV